MAPLAMAERSSFAERSLAPAAPLVETPRDGLEN
jgi:hypothetical protein